MFISVETLPIFFTCVFIFFQPMNFEDAVQELLADQLGSWIGLIDLKTIIGACEEVKSNPTLTINHKTKMPRTVEPVHNHIGDISLNCNRLQWSPLCLEGCQQPPQPQVGDSDHEHLAE